MRTACRSSVVRAHQRCRSPDRACAAGAREGRPRTRRRGRRAGRLARRPPRYAASRSGPSRTACPPSSSSRCRRGDPTASRAACARGPAARLGAGAQAPEPGRGHAIPRERRRERRQRLADEDVPVAGAAEHAGEPLGFGAHAVEHGGGRERRDEREAGSAGGASRSASGAPTRGRRRRGGRARWRRSAAGIRADGQTSASAVVTSSASATPCALAGADDQSRSPRRSAMPRSALLAVMIATGRSSASRSARPNRFAAAPDSSSISISAIGTRRFRPSRVARISP